jgi:F-type H+-transporting ATPase subunit b
MRPEKRVENVLDINWTLPVALVSVIVFLVLMNKILFKPLIQFMDARDKGIRDNLDEAARLRQQAESALTSYEAAIGAARRDMAEQAAAVQRAMDAKQREQIEQARNEAHTLAATAQATITRETQEARSRLVDAARELARLVVVKLMGREVSR